MRKPQVIPDEDHEVVYERVAAVDVAKKDGVVCLRQPHPSRAGQRQSVVWTVTDLPRAFRTADLRLIHAAICCSRYSLWTCCGVRY